jgi:ribosomal protein L20
LIGSLKKAQVSLDRKSLSTLAMEHPEVFARVVKALN